MEERSLFHRMRQIFREEGETEEVGSQAMKLIRNIVRYLDKDAKDIMTHRRDIVGIDEEETLETALKFMLGERFSRFPVYREDIDEIIGKKAVVIESIDNLQGTGKVRYQGMEWTARAEEENDRIEKDAEVEIIAVKGVKLIVKMKG